VRCGLLGKHVVEMRQWSRKVDHQLSRQPYLVSIAAGEGAMVAHKLGLEPTDKRDPTKVPPGHAGEGAAGN
jgi:hypothetical protein